MIQVIKSLQNPCKGLKYTYNALKIEEIKKWNTYRTLKSHSNANQKI